MKIDELNASIRREAVTIMLVNNSEVIRVKEMAIWGSSDMKKSINVRTQEV